jgi:hypothetical protein
LNLETINGGIDPFNTIIVRAANPNKKLGWWDYESGSVSQEWKQGDYW